MDQHCISLDRTVKIRKDSSQCWSPKWNRTYTTNKAILLLAQNKELVALVARGCRDHWEVMTMGLADNTEAEEEEARDSVSLQPGQTMTNRFLDRGCRMCKASTSLQKIKASLGCGKVQASSGTRRVSLVRALLSRGERQLAAFRKEAETKPPAASMGTGPVNKVCQL